MRIHITGFYNQLSESMMLYLDPLSHLVRERLKEDGGGRDLGFAREEAVSQMSTVGQIQSHNSG